MHDGGDAARRLHRTDRAEDAIVGGDDVNAGAFQRMREIALFAGR